jgi:5'-methylthioadenosine phosphorylase
MKTTIDAGIIGGSGLYQIDGVTIVDEVSVKTPWGMPSDIITIAEIDGVRAGFLPRHGRGHFILPHEINYRANIAALKMLGAGQIIAFSAVGSLKDRIKPLDFVIPDQIIDRTKYRISTFFGDGIVAHIAFADPFCSRLHELILVAAQQLNIPMHTNEILICMEGPAFSTRAESHLYRSWQAGVINMSTLPEAKLAREAEMCYAVICMSTDYDCWKEDEEHVTVDMVVNNLNKNAANAKALIKQLVPLLKQERTCACKEAIKYAIMTDSTKQPQKQKKKLKAILPNYFS